MVTRMADMSRWRVALTRPEAGGGPLSDALRRHGFVPVSCPVLVEGPPADPDAFAHVVARVHTYHWVICASVRAVEAIGRLRPEPWPTGVRTAAVGPATARALVSLGASPPPVVASTAGAEALWAALEPHDTWPARRVLVLTTTGGRTALIDGLRAAGADVEVADAYEMVPRPAAEIARDWSLGGADAVVVTSPRAATALVDAIGREALLALHAVVAMGHTTAQALREFGIVCHVPPRAAFDAAAKTLVNVQEQGAGSTTPAPHHRRRQVRP